MYENSFHYVYDLTVSWFFFASFYVRFVLGTSKPSENLPCRKKDTTVDSSHENWWSTYTMARSRGKESAWCRNRICFGQIKAWSRDPLRLFRIDILWLLSHICKLFDKFIIYSKLTSKLRPTKSMSIYLHSSRLKLILNTNFAKHEKAPCTFLEKVAIFTKRKIIYTFYLNLVEMQSGETYLSLGGMCQNFIYMLIIITY